MMELFIHPKCLYHFFEAYQYWSVEKSNKFCKKIYTHPPLQDFNSNVGIYEGEGSTVLITEERVSIFLLAKVVSNIFTCFCKIFCMANITLWYITGVVLIDCNIQTYILLFLFHCVNQWNKGKLSVQILINVNPIFCYHQLIVHILLHKKDSCTFRIKRRNHQVSASTDM